MNLRIKANAFIKGVVLLSKPHIFLFWLEKPMQFLSNTISLSRWISKQDKAMFNDFYTYKRNYDKREILFKKAIDDYKLKDEIISYYEFGVASGKSFRWWMDNLKNDNSKFYGFDTFEGLPEDWGFYQKGDMSSNIPILEDKRAEFIKGLFQDTLFGFIKEGKVEISHRKIIHMDADIFSSTLFCLTSLAPYLRSGDLIFFDEFNVPNHEFFAYKIFSNSFYIDLKLIGGVNNYYQTAFIVK